MNRQIVQCTEHGRRVVLNVRCLVAGIEMEVVDFCAISNGGCDHKCQHTRDGPICSCRKGYKLMADKKGCRGMSGITGGGRGGGEDGGGGGERFVTVRGVGEL